VIDHETARRSFATSLDFALDPAEREALDTHLTGCPACRSFTAALRSDAAVIRELETSPVPAAVRANIAIAAERGRGSSPVGRWVGIAVVGALLIGALGAGALGVGGRPGGGDGANGGPGPSGQTVVTEADAQINWKTQVVLLMAREFSIDVRGKTFRAATPAIDVSSDPGNATYRTLEATWKENGVEMRLSLYFKGDAIASWVDEIRIYDGEVDGKWLTARGTFFKTPLGAQWTGDQDIAVADPNGQPARVHFGDMLLINHPFDGVNEPVGGGIVLPENARPFGIGGNLHCSGILQMSPQDAEVVLLKLGYRLSWRLMRTTGPATGYADMMARAPAGILIEEPTAGSEGELIVFVAPMGDPKAVPLPYPADCPVHDPNQTPPTPVPAP
jgi:hypothetical protein